ncbi:unnamed protein product [Heterobilharzia americana]|nr:unnamed protein product [Heterobilharzia americana]CAH8504862.1 unnamed protein product [Heterobilharzia americana]
MVMTHFHVSRLSIRRHNAAQLTVKYKALKIVEQINNYLYWQNNNQCKIIIDLPLSNSNNMQSGKVTMCNKSNRNL